MHGLHLDAQSRRQYRLNCRMAARSKVEATSGAAGPVRPLGPELTHERVELDGLISAVAVVPPPHTGMTMISLQVLDELQATHRSRCIRVSRTEGSRTLGWRATKHVRLVVGALRLVCRVQRPRYLYFVADSGHGLWGTAAIALLARAAGVRPAIHHHVWRYVDEPTLASRAMTRAAGRSAGHLVLCDAMAEALARSHGVERVRVVCNAAMLVLEPELPAHVSAEPPGDLRLGMLGNLTMEKGVGLAIAVLSELEGSGLKATLVLAGPFDRAVAEAVRAAQDGGLRVELIGSVYGPKKSRFLASLDCLLFPSLYRNEADPLVLHEAARIGTPCIATQRGCVRSRPGLHAIDEHAYVDRATAILLDQSALDSLSTAARAAACHVPPSTAEEVLSARLWLSKLR